jgi:Delta24(24(1))-sterol reductase
MLTRLSIADGKARKVHYTCDLFFALTWGAMTGFNSPFPWFYPVFFSCMIVHRAIRDIQRCRRKYGKAWEQYEKEVPYLFIPVSAASSCVEREMLTRSAVCFLKIALFAWTP